MKKSIILAVVALGIAGCNEKPANENAPDPSPDREADSGLTTNSADQTTVMAPDGALDAALPQSAQEFANGAAASDAFEIEGARIALSRGASDEVKAFAQTMIDAHTQSTAKLKQAVSKAQGVVSPAETPDPVMAEKLEALRALEGAAFDKAYSAEQVDAHQNALKMLRNYAVSGTEPALKAFANETASVVEGHLEEARGLKP